MKRLFVLVPLLILTVILYTAVAMGQTPPITVPPKWDVPEQAQASNQAVPDVDHKESTPRTVLTVVLCNNVVGLVVIDDTGIIHPVHVETKQQVDATLSLVDAEHAKSMNLGCPSDATKDTTVL